MFMRNLYDVLTTTTAWFQSSEVIASTQDQHNKLEQTDKRDGQSCMTYIV